MEWCQELLAAAFFRRRIYAREEEEGRGSRSPRIKLEDERAQGQGGRVEESAASQRSRGIGSTKSQCLLQKISKVTISGEDTAQLPEAEVSLEQDPTHNMQAAWPLTS